MLCWDQLFSTADKIFSNQISTTPLDKMQLPCLLPRCISLMWHISAAILHSTAVALDTSHKLGVPSDVIIIPYPLLLTRHLSYCNFFL